MGQTSPKSCLKFKSQTCSVPSKEVCLPVNYSSDGPAPPCRDRLLQRLTQATSFVNALLMTLQGIAFGLPSD